MANKIQVKRSSVAGKVPVVGDIDLGEFAVNTYDGKMYLKKDDGTPSIVEIVNVNGALGTPSSGTVTNLTGTASININGTVGATTPTTVVGTTITGNTKVVTPFVDATNSAGGALRNSSGVAQLQWGAGGGSNVSMDVATNLNPANASISIAPTGIGSVTINPATAGTINKMSIGVTTAAAGAFTTLSSSSTTTLNGLIYPSADGTTNQVIKTDGAGNLSFATVASGGYTSKTVTTNTTLNANSEYETGKNLRVNHGVTLAIPATSRLNVRNYATGTTL